MDAERVEFLDGPESGEAADDVVAVGRDPGDGGARPGRRWWLAGAAAVVLVVGLAVATNRGDGTAGAGPDGRPSTGTSAAPTPATAATGVIRLPRAIGDIRQLVAASSDDVVWALDRGAGIVRIAAGRVTAVQLLESQVDEIAVSSDGTRLYAAVGGNRPTLQAMDATTLALGASLPLPSGAQTLVVALDGVWAVSGRTVLQIDGRDLTVIGSRQLPGVITADHVRVSAAADGTERLTALVTTGAGGGRLLDLDTATGAVGLGPAIPGALSVATSPSLTWISSTTAGADPTQVTQGFAAAADTSPTATSASVPLGGRVFDGGPGMPAFYDVVPGTSVVRCHDYGGFAAATMDVATTVPGATVTGALVRAQASFYLVTDRGLVRTGVGPCG